MKYHDFARKMHVFEVFSQKFHNFMNITSRQGKRRRIHSRKKSQSRKVVVAKSNRSFKLADQIFFFVKVVPKSRLLFESRKKIVTALRVPVYTFQPKQSHRQSSY